MLRQLSQDEYMQYLDSAYELALDMSRSCYPTYADGLKTRADFNAHAARSFDRDDYTMLLYEQDGAPLGLIQFYVMDDDRYIQPDIFCIKRDYGRAVREFVEYLHMRFPGYELHFGVSRTNTGAVEALESLDFEREEVSLGGVLRFVDGSMEIFGVDFEDDRFNAEDFRTLMVRALNQSKKDGMKDMTFFHENETHPAAESVGIRIIDTYYGHKLTL